MFSLTYKHSRKIKIILITFIVVVLGAVMITFVRYRRLLENPQELITANHPGANLSLDDIHHTAIRDGRKEWDLDADSANYIDKDKKVLLDRLSMTFFMDNQEEIHLTARSGILETASKDILIKGDVVLTNDRARLVTEQLRYRHETRHVDADRPVDITGDNFRLSAEQMSLDLNRNRATFTGKVKGSFSEDLSL